MRDRLKQLSAGVAIYGAGDAAIQIVNFGLMAVYVKGGFLSSYDYGALAAIGAIEAFARVVSRLGLDGAFMRYYHERGETLPRFASTISWFLLACNLAIFGALLTGSVWLGDALFDDPHYIPAFQLMLVNTFLMALTFLPFHTMRMRQQAARYSAFTFARSVGTLILRIVLVIGLGYGLGGIYAADLIVTLAILPFLWPWFRPWLRPLFSFEDLRTALRFGLPRVPHGLAQQAIDGGNKLLFGQYITQAQLGIYQNAVTLGTGVKFFTSAFETAWAPFYYATARQPDGRVVLARTATYACAVLVLLAAGTVAVARDAVLVMLTPEYLAAAPVLPIVAVGIALQGIYLLTSVGLNLSGRTEFYPIATFAAAGVGFGAGVWLMPAYGAVGAAMAFALSYLVQAAVAVCAARWFFPIPFEAGRIFRLVLSGIVAATLGALVVPSLHPIGGLLVRGVVVIAVYAGGLWATGFLRPTERAAVHELLSRLRSVKQPSVERNAQ